MSKTHFTWSIESPRGKCPDCDEDTHLISAPSGWEIHETDDNFEELRQNGNCAELREEITGHFCIACNKLVSLSLNT